MACLDVLSKYLLISVNFVITLISLVIIGAGAAILYFNNTFGSQLDFSKPLFVFMPIIIICGGVLLFLIGSFGCCGFIAEKPGLLFTYVVCMILLLAGSSYLTIKSRQELKAAGTELVAQLDKTFDNPESRGIFFVLEGLLKCCGTTGPDSYLERNLTISVTCCANPSLGNVTITDVADIGSLQLCQRDQSYAGCSVYLAGVMSSLNDVVYYFLIAILVVQSTGILTAGYIMFELWNSMRIVIDPRFLVKYS